MGNVKDLISISTLPSILTKEGFLDVKLSYLGGLWVLLEFNSESIKDKALCHIGVNSWFNALQTATNDFVSDERVVWVDIEGIPMHVWSRDTFMKIGKKWGEAVDMEESHDSSFARKRLCVKTKLSYNILEGFKVISKGKVFMVRAKELFTWTPQFRAHKPDEYVSDDEPPIGDTNTHVEPLSSDDEVAGDSDGEGVSETNFGDKPLSPPKSVHKDSSKADDQHSADPFGLYDQLYRPINDRTIDEDPLLSHPLGFTPEVSQQEKYYTSSHIKEKCNDHGDKADRSPIVHPRVMNFSQESNVNESSSGASSIKCPRNTGKGGSILEVLDEMIRVGQSMGYDMEGCSKDIERIIALQETKMENISHMDVKFMWGNSNYHFVSSDSAGNSGGILCVWEDSMFKKDSVSVSDNFIALFGTWLPNNTKVLIVTIYAPQSRVLKRTLWEYISLMISRWHGESIVLGVFNEVWTEEERFGSLFNRASARDFNSFISSAGLVEIKSEGYSYTWSHPSVTKMSKLDRFLVSKGIISNFSAIMAVCLDRHLSDHRPILLKEIHTDFGSSPFRLYHSWFKWEGFDAMVEQAWNSFSHSDPNRLIRFKKKLQDLKKTIRIWIKDKKALQSGAKRVIIEDLAAIDKRLDRGAISDEVLIKRMELTRKLNDIKQSDATEFTQKAKVQWVIEGDENSRFFHGLINKKRSQLSIRGVFVDGDWITNSKAVKDAFRDHFASRYKKPVDSRLKLNIQFPNRLSSKQVEILDNGVSRAEIRDAVWGCGVNKSPGPDGFTFEFFRQYWNFLSTDFCEAVESFFVNGAFPKGNNASFITFIPKVMEAKFVTDFRPISFIGSVYKVVTKILTNRLSMVISDLVSDSQSAFVANRQILDGTFILNEILAWCKKKKKQALIFKADFAKAYDSVRWDYLLDVLQAFGFGPNWCKWISGIFTSAMASVLINESPTFEFLFFCGLKQGDPLAPFLFILVMESLHIFVSKAVNEGVFKGLQIHESVSISHLFLDSGVSRAEIRDGSLWSRVIKAIYGASLGSHSVKSFSPWSSILRETQVLSGKGFDFLSHTKKRVGNGLNTKFWLDHWILDSPLRVRFPRMFSLERDKHVLVADKWRSSDFKASFRREIRGRVEHQQWIDLLSILGTVTLSPSNDRWICELNGDGIFRVKDIRGIIDDLYLPSSNEATRWIKCVPIKINVFAWQARLDRLPTRCNLLSRGVEIESLNCPICGQSPEDARHTFFNTIWPKLCFVGYVGGGTSSGWI
uniref:RNA-directed DNA polymerase, eukaryota n=1 Tax=Tanacetum cinerariifolium TaxID=118510 RepID=A0A699IB79_TANCI|nr:RNA-directed DNA polymerase, eukaryota [Tanacetum cinerariifolium]